MKCDFEEKDEDGSEKKPVEVLHTKIARAESDNNNEHIHLFIAQMLQEQKAEVVERQIIDLGASSSMTFNCEWLANYYELSKPKKVWMENKRYIYAVGVGQVKITMYQKAIYLVQNVYYVSVSQTSFSLYLHNQWTDFHKLSCSGKPQMRAIHTYVGCTKATMND